MTVTCYVRIHKTPKRYNLQVKEPGRNWRKQCCLAYTDENITEEQITQKAKDMIENNLIDVRSPDLMLKRDEVKFVFE